MENKFTRPWGYYVNLEEEEKFLVKRIVVAPKGKLSVQYHNHRKEHWVVLEGKALVLKGEEQKTLTVGECVDIGVKEVHSLQNPYDEPLQILEVQYGDILEETDIVRLEDIYGRADS